MEPVCSGDPASGSAQATGPQAATKAKAKADLAKKLIPTCKFQQPSVSGT
jgi:hypothetical protein